MDAKGNDRKHYRGIEKQTDNPFLNLYHIDALGRDGTPFHYYFASRNDENNIKHKTHSMRPEGMAVYAVTEDGEKLVLVRQYRYPVNDYLYELPAGLIEPEETASEAACREMIEETGWKLEVYEGGEPVFIDTEYDTWNMDPVALEKAFEIYPDTKVVVVAHLYGTPGKVDELNAIIKKHGAILVEDAAESMGATYKGVQTGTFGKYNTISFNGNKIITGSAGGCFLTDDEEAANKVRKWSTQARENAAWYQHEELGYNYRMSNVVAGVVRGQFPYLKEHIAQKKAIYERYKEGLKGLPVSMNPMDLENSEPNYWLSCLIINKEAMCKQVRGEQDVCYVKETGKSCPTEILEAIASINAEGRPIWKPMHMQPIYRLNPFVVRDGNGRARSNAYIAGGVADVGMDIFTRGLCLPSDNKMTAEQQDRIIEVIKACFE